PLALQPRAVITAHRFGDKPAALAPNPNPSDDRGDPHPKYRGRAPPRQATLNRPNNTLAQIPRIRSCHACWPPAPASSLNHILTPAGIPYADSVSPDFALVWSPFPL